jgi:hypothetical protein
MKIEKIELKDGIFYVTQNSDFIEKLFGSKREVVKYRNSGSVFYYFQHIIAFCREDGVMLSPTDKVCTALNNYIHKF